MILLINLEWEMLGIDKNGNPVVNYMQYLLNWENLANGESIYLILEIPLGSVHASVNAPGEHMIAARHR